MEKRSGSILHGTENAYYRATFRSMGFSDDDVSGKRPLIGIANAWSECVPGHYNLRQVAEKAENPADYGLATPQARVTMLYRDGTETAWLLGDKAPTSTAFYWMKEGEEAVYLLYASAAQSLNMERNAMHTLRLPATLDAARIRNLEIGRSGQDTVEIGYSTEEEAEAWIRLRADFGRLPPQSGRTCAIIRRRQFKTLRSTHRFGTGGM